MILIYLNLFLGEETVVLHSEITNIIDRLTSPSKSKSTENVPSTTFTATSPNNIGSAVSSAASHSDDFISKPDNFVSNGPPQSDLVSKPLQDSNDDMDKYWKLIPYQTDNPQKISQQESILELLISNGICNDETFKIFITEPDLHKQEAEKILDSLYCVTTSLPDQFNDNTEYVNTEWYSHTGASISITTEHVSGNNESDLNKETENILMSPDSQMSNMTSSLALGKCVYRMVSQSALFV